MSKKSIFTWIGVVSGLITILLVFENPFTDKASLMAYIETQEILTSDKRHDDGKPYDSVYVLKISLKNTGELPANKVHINYRNGYRKAVVRVADKYIDFSNQDSIYIDTIEPESEVDIFFWGSIFLVSHYNLEQDLTISSFDSGKAVLRTNINGDDVIWYIEKYFIYLAMLPLFIFLIYVQVWGDSTTKKAIDKSCLESKLKELNYAWSIGLITEDEFQEKGKELLEASIKSGKKA